MSPDVTRHPVGPQRSCLGNKTEASPVGTAHGGGPARLNEVASVTRPRHQRIDGDPDYPYTASTKLPR